MEEEKIEVKELTMSERLSQEFPEEKIKNRIIYDCGKEKVISYVSGSDVIRRLNECFGLAWDFVVTDKIVDVDIGQVAILGSLTVTINTDGNVTKITKQQWGSSQIGCFNNGRVVSLGDDIKTATTDSLKKCATMLGVALYLYDGDEKGNISSSDPVPLTKESKQKLESYRNDNDEEKKITKSQINSIIKICKENNITKDKLFEVLKVKEMSEISYSVAASFIVNWNAFFKEEEFKLQSDE